MTTQPRRAGVRTRIVATLLAGLAGATLAVAGPVSEAQALPRQCWYQGEFEVDGIWYQGWFREAC